MTVEERQARLEQVMTALAEAQVKTEDSLNDFTRETKKFTQETKTAQARTDAQLAQLGETMNALAVQVRALTTHLDALAQAQTKTEIQFQAYLNTRKN